MSSLFSQHLNFFSLSTSFLYCNMGRGEMSSFFLFFFVVWFLQAATGNRLGRGKGKSAARWAGKETHTTSRFNLHLIKAAFTWHFFFCFSVLFWPLYSTSTHFENSFQVCRLYFLFFLIIWLRKTASFTFFLVLRSVFFHASTFPIIRFPVSMSFYQIFYSIYFYMNERIYPFLSVRLLCLLLLFCSFFF